MTFDKCSIIELPVIHDRRGNLTFIEGGDHVPFQIQRVYYLYDVPSNSRRPSSFTPMATTTAREQTC